MYARVYMCDVCDVMVPDGHVVESFRVCMYVYVCVYMCIYVCVCVYVCMCVCVHGRAYMCV